MNGNLLDVATRSQAKQMRLTVCRTKKTHMKSPDNRRLLGTPTEKFTTTTCFTLEQTTLTPSVKIKNS